MRNAKQGNDLNLPLLMQGNKAIINSTGSYSLKCFSSFKSTGYFYIRRGTNEVGIESGVTAGTVPAANCE